MRNTHIESKPLHELMVLERLASNVTTLCLCYCWVIVPSDNSSIFDQWIIKQSYPTTHYSLHGNINTPPWYFVFLSNFSNFHVLFVRFGEAQFRNPIGSVTQEFLTPARSGGVWTYWRAYVSGCQISRKHGKSLPGPHDHSKNSFLFDLLLISINHWDLHLMYNQFGTHS